MSKQLSPTQLRRMIRDFPSKPRVTCELEHTLSARGTPDKSREHYSSQKEHWLCWLADYKGSGYYGRKEWKRTAEFVYNHINCPPMVLWLGEASGIDKETVTRAKRAALRAGVRFTTQCAAIRRHIPWARIEERLLSIK